jgi:hypothetical protein
MLSAVVVAAKALVQAEVLAPVQVELEVMHTPMFLVLRPERQ